MARRGGGQRGGDGGVNAGRQQMSLETSVRCAQLCVQAFRVAVRAGYTGDTRRHACLDTRSLSDHVGRLDGCLGRKRRAAFAGWHGDVRLDVRVVRRHELCLKLRRVGSLRS